MLFIASASVELLNHTPQRIRLPGSDKMCLRLFGCDGAHWDVPSKSRALSSSLVFSARSIGLTALKMPCVLVEGTDLLSSSDPYTEKQECNRPFEVLSGTFLFAIFLSHGKGLESTIFVISGHKYGRARLSDYPCPLYAVEHDGDGASLFDVLDPR